MRPLKLPIALLVGFGLGMALLSACGFFAPNPAPTPTAVPTPAPSAVPSPTPTVVLSPTPTASPGLTSPATPPHTATAAAPPTPTPTPSGPEAALVGDWEGVLSVLRSEIPISATLQIEDGQLWGTIDIDSRQIEDLTFTAELQPDGRVRFVIPQEGSDLTFEGVLEDGVITGGFRVGLIGGTFTLEHVPPPAAPAGN